MTQAELEKEIEKWFDNWIADYFLHPEAFDSDLRKSVVIDELLTLIDKHTKEYVEKILPKEKKINSLVSRKLKEECLKRYYLEREVTSNLSIVGDLLYNQALKDIKDSLKEKVGEK